MKHACEDTNTQNVFSGNVATAGTGRVILYYSRIKNIYLFDLVFVFIFNFVIYKIITFAKTVV